MSKLQKAFALLLNYFLKYAKELGSGVFPRAAV